MSQRPSSGSTNLSPLQQFALLPEADRENFLRGLSDDQKAALAYRWEGWLARPDQQQPAGDWRFWFIKAGRGYGKTRTGAETVRDWVHYYEYVNIIGATADDARDIMIEGESGILAICPPWERPEYKPSKRQLEWPNGARSLIFTADEPERLRGKQHARIWADEIAAWRYPEAWDQAMFGLRLGADPRAVVTSTPKSTPLVRDLIANRHTVVTNGSTYDNLANLAPAFAEEIIAKYEGTRLGRQELLGELLDDEGLAYRFSETVHVVPPFVVPDSFERFESLDFGVSNPTAILVYAVDYDGNLLVFDGLYQPGLPSQIAPLVEAKRDRWWDARDPHGRRIPHPVYADPSIWNKTGVTNRLGQPASTADEFTDCGLPVAKANNDRRAGFVRVSELLKQDESRRFPAWHPMRGQPGSPKLFVFDVRGTRDLREQLAVAPLEESETGPYQGPHPGEAVAQKWEGPNGHAHASLRYGVMSRPSPSVQPKQPNPDPRRAFLDEVEQQQLEKSSRRRYIAA